MLLVLILAAQLAACSWWLAPTADTVRADFIRVYPDATLLGVQDDEQEVVGITFRVTYRKPGMTSDACEVWGYTYTEQSRWQRNTIVTPCQ